MNLFQNDKNVISATTDYSSNIVCSVEKENIFGTQFHPEKSDKIGLKIIEKFYKFINETSFAEWIWAQLQKQILIIMRILIVKDGDINI